MSGIRYKLDTTNLDKLKKKHPDRVDKVLGKLAGDSEAYIKTNFSRTAPNPSSPGSPPAVQTGRLKKSVLHRKVREQVWEVTEGGNGAPYAGYLEFGTHNMAARPHFRDGVYAVIRKAPKMLIGTIEDL